tara:strand:- start:26109 stop:26897 length:789 start_codon:yes stop_codon:yes gene_type:complete
MPRTKSSDTKRKSGPSIFSRDSDGLLINTDYEFNEDGSINWRAMVKEDHLFPNKLWFQNRGKDTPRSTEGLADHQLLIKLGGIKELAKLRGFSKLSYEVVKCEEEHVAVICTMTFLPNYETFGEPVTFQDMANATLNNTSSFATKFLETIACNRAFVRCVRNFLQVHIVGDDEIDKSDGPSKVTPKYKSPSPANPLSPTSSLQNKALEVLGCESFADFKSNHIKVWWQEKIEGIYSNDSIKKAEDWSDVDAKDARIMLGLIN